MKAFQMIIEGNWAHFKKPETNNNPLTHDFITKTAFVGLMGAVLEKSRKEMKPLFPQLCEDILYGVALLKPVKKISWGFTLRRAVNLMKKAPKQMEFLKDPAFKVAVALKSPSSEELYAKFLGRIKNSESSFTPVLGLHNCPAHLKFESEGKFSEKKSGSFETQGFVSADHQLDTKGLGQFRVGLDKIPTFQNNDFWNLPERYCRIVYPSAGKIIKVTGEYYQYSGGDFWWLT